MDTEDALDLIEQLIRIPGLTVKLVDEGEDRDMTHHTDLEQLDGLRLDTLRTIDDHDRTVGCHEGSVGILREVLVSRCIQDVNALSFIIKLKHRGGNRNTSLLLDLHPVGNRMLGRLPSLDGTCEIDRTSIQEELLRQCRLTGIRVRNNRKRTSLLDFFF